MRGLASLATILASLATIGAAVVRLMWSKPKFKEVQDDRTGYRIEVAKEPLAPPWLRKAARWWLILVFFGGTAIALIVVGYTLFSLS